jgi:hypothetical protein
MPHPRCRLGDASTCYADSRSALARRPSARWAHGTESRRRSSGTTSPRLSPRSLPTSTSVRPYGQTPTESTWLTDNA